MRLAEYDERDLVFMGQQRKHQGSWLAHNNAVLEYGSSTAYDLSDRMQQVGYVLVSGTNNVFFACCGLADSPYVDQFTDVPLEPLSTDGVLGSYEHRIVSVEVG